MDKIQLIILVFGFVFAVLAAYGVTARWQLGWAAVACLLLAMILGGGARVFGIH